MGERGAGEENSEISILLLPSTYNIGTSCDDFNRSRLLYGEESRRVTSGYHRIFADDNIQSNPIKPNIYHQSHNLLRPILEYTSYSCHSDVAKYASQIIASWNPRS
ncbi:uncharacterized protein EAF01_002050 [Botrytis porri]|uniref:uncharacterized protein n=1 Tax=Botrytis porri TaxID=87229 RepID=UPI0018FF7F2B|nr:uncharacterized protein EAF01_002050 [Botrytis porri]KAF7913029.1 hypothetical protein EAF01_002050 [Botrytis porri]